MYIPDRAFVQRVGRPGVASLLASDHAQSMVLRRSGQPDVTVRALVLPWQDTPQGNGTTDTPGLWMGLLSHLAPVTTALDFQLVRPGGEVLTLMAAPENIAGADVAWLLRLRPLADPVYPVRSTWSDGVLRSVKVWDPARDSGAGAQRLVEAPIPASLRRLAVRPGDPLPLPGASVAYQGGQLVLGIWSDADDLTGQRVGICRLVDDRAYPSQATVPVTTPQNTVTPLSLRLRIEANTRAAATVPAGNDLQTTPGPSHTGHLPPGVHLSPGQVLTETASGVRYLVVQPVQPDSLGDTVGLSWQGDHEAHGWQ